MILSRLADGPAHGYEIKKHVERILGRSINNNVLYPSLRRFEERGAIERAPATGTEPAEPGRPPRNVFQITDTGHDMLQAMLRDADPALLAEDAEFQTRVAFFEEIDPEDRTRIIAARRSVVGERIAHNAALRAVATDRPWGARVIDFTVAQLRRELDWLSELDELNSPNPPEDGHR